MDIYGRWLRLYPVSFRLLEHRQKFTRWDRIRFKWRMPDDDNRVESRRVDQGSIEIVGELRPSERERFLAGSIVRSLQREREAGRSLALLRPEVREFFYEKKTAEELKSDARKIETLRSQGDLFSKQVTRYGPCPYRFCYRYRIEEGERTGTCQDWEIEATYFNWSKQYGEDTALRAMQQTFGSDYPSNGMLLAMGTHSRYPDTWLINGVIRLDDVTQPTLF